MTTRIPTRALAALLIATTLILTVGAPARAAEPALLELIRILHAKGSISDEEYALLQAAAEAPAAPATPVESAPAVAVVTSAPPAAKPKSEPAVAFKGDFRLRYQGQDTATGNWRDRARYRYRLGISASPVEDWEFAAGLASGSSDLRSTNQTFSDTFSSKPVNIDYAYARYQIGANTSVIGGKIRSAAYLYLPSDLMWDSDINPEGFSFNHNQKWSSGSAFVNGGAWILDESSNGKDPYLTYLQAGTKFSADRLFGTVAATWYHIGKNDAPGDFETEGVNSDYRFGEIYHLGGEIGMSELFGGNVRASLIGEVVTNADTITDEDTGYLFGAKLASGPWAFRYNRASLDRNAWPDILPDSDRLDGLTGMRGHEFIIEYQLMKNVLLGIDYYLSHDRVLDLDQDLLQVDLNFRF